MAQQPLAALATKRDDPSSVVETRVMEAGLSSGLLVCATNSLFVYFSLKHVVQSFSCCWFVLFVFKTEFPCLELAL